MSSLTQQTIIAHTGEKVIFAQGNFCIRAGVISLGQHIVHDEKNPTSSQWSYSYRYTSCCYMWNFRGCTVYIKHYSSWSYLVCFFIIVGPTLKGQRKKNINKTQWSSNANYHYTLHRANMGPTLVLSAPDGPHVGPMNLAIRVAKPKQKLSIFGAIVKEHGDIIAKSLV